MGGYETLKHKKGKAKAYKVIQFSIAQFVFNI